MVYLDSNSVDSIVGLIEKARLAYLPMGLALQHFTPDRQSELLQAYQSGLCNIAFIVLADPAIDVLSREPENDLVGSNLAQ